jgi:hypothetical protein
MGMEQALTEKMLVRRFYLYEPFLPATIPVSGECFFDRKHVIV